MFLNYFIEVFVKVAYVELFGRRFMSNLTSSQSLLPTLFYGFIPVFLKQLNSKMRSFSRLFEDFRWISTKILGMCAFNSGRLQIENICLNVFQLRAITNACRFFKANIQHIQIAYVCDSVVSFFCCFVVENSYMSIIQLNSN